ncbi:NAD(P)H-dependent oxidoreductase subunit E, partial [bacterium]|nr:NAD(P)H-dependent oxidoreductase subunit E [candidate division CSSED10-310 bacterium]
MRFESVGQLEEYRQVLTEKRKTIKTQIFVCAGTGCLANGSRAVFEAIRQALADHGLEGKADVEFKCTGCHGFCQHGPLVVIEPGAVFYQMVKPKDAHDIVEKTILAHEVIPRLLYRDPASKQRIEKHTDIPFYNRQHRNALRNIGRIDPGCLDDAIVAGCYRALGKTLQEFTPNGVIDAITRSGLRGCGGGGFPTGKKWLSCVNAGGDTRYLICNGDEGDPGAFMDRSIMEGDPHSVLEGMTIGAFAIGARQGYIYVRAEYPLAVE